MIFIVIGILILLLLVFCAVLVKLTLYPTTRTYIETYNIEIADGNFTEDYFNSLPKEEVYIQARQGYKLHGFWIKGGDEKKIVVLAHGYRFSLFGSIKYIPIFLKLGYSVLAFDNRYHGLSGGPNTTFGIKEQYDLMSVYDYLMDRFGEDIRIGTHGESLGAATALMHGAKDERVSFIVADCAYSGMKEILAYQLKVRYRLPMFPFIPIASFLSMFITGVPFCAASPRKSAQKITAPTFIIHGRCDSNTPFEQAQAIYDALKCKKRFYGAEGAEHARSVVTDKEKYFDEVEQFLQENDLL